MRFTQRLLLSFLLMAPFCAFGCQEENSLPDESRPLVKAIDSCDVLAVRKLLSADENPNDFAAFDYAPLHMAAAAGPEILGAFLEIGRPNLELKDKRDQQWTPIFYAIDWGHVDSVQSLIKAGANVNAKTSHGYSVLHMAAGSSKNAVKMTSILIEHGANLNAIADNKTTVLQSAIQHGNGEVVAMLLKSGADPEVKTFFGTTVLSDAVGFEEINIVKTLLKFGVSLQVQDSKTGYSPLHKAAASGNFEITQILVASGADMSLLTSDGLLPEDVAQQENHNELASAIRKARLSKSRDLNVPIQYSQSEDEQDRDVREFYNQIDPDSLANALEFALHQNAFSDQLSAALTMHYKELRSVGQSKDVALDFLNPLLDVIEHHEAQCNHGPEPLKGVHLRIVDYRNYLIAQGKSLEQAKHDILSDIKFWSEYELQRTSN